jgi:mevalonate kinase
LDGAPAVVLAIDRGVECRVEMGHGIATPDGDSRFVEPAVGRLAEAALFRFKEWNPVALPEGGKPGFGGSAAACVAACLAVGRDVEEAFEIHRTVQGSGSGIDVAASIHGGMLRFQDGKTHALRPPVQPTVIWSGQSARTGPRVQQYLEWSGRVGFVDASEDLVSGFTRDPVGSTAALLRLLSSMAAQAGIDYLTPPLERICQLARVHGGAAKPSGAGGGDCAVAFFHTRGQEEAFQRQCQREGFQIIEAHPSSGAWKEERTE